MHELRSVAILYLGFLPWWLSQDEHRWKHSRLS